MWELKDLLNFSFVHMIGLFFTIFFAIKTKRIIIEFHGTAFHPKTSVSDWKCMFGNHTAEEKYNLDIQKENMAINAGFDVITVWSDKTPEENIQYILKQYERITNNL